MSSRRKVVDVVRRQKVSQVWSSECQIRDSPKPTVYGLFDDYRYSKSLQVEVLLKYREIGISKGVIP